jgi:hypothetical protein
METTTVTTKIGQINSGSRAEDWRMCAAVSQRPREKEAQGRRTRLPPANKKEKERKIDQKRSNERTAKRNK